ncbi:MAG: MobA/MobL family protein [Pseudolabrys sp.]|nr:MobA/MobL family protein [Pseudolabrys sp.]
MPIAFVRVRFLNVLRDGGACKALSYIGRTAIRDDRLGRTFDCKDVAHDLVHERLLLPHGAPFTSVAELANALDEAERRRQRRSTKRKRWPQFGAHLIFALPSDEILTVDEAAELVDRLVSVAIGGSSLLPVYVAIHDPALEQPGAQTRHAHVMIGLRAVEGTGLSPLKVRHLFARPRHATAPNTGSNYVAEGLAWPDIARDLQDMMLREIGCDALVDPPAPFSGRHWSTKVLREAPERRTRHDQMAHRQNVELINGDPAVLVARMLRGRSVMRIDEVHRLIARFLDSEEDRQLQLDTILTDTKIVPLSNDASSAKPEWLTTKAVYDSMRDALAIAKCAEAERRDRIPTQSPTLEVVLASAEPPIANAILTRVLTLPRSTRRPLVLGEKYSDCSAVAAELSNWRPIIGTFAALNAPRHGSRRSREGRIGLQRGGLIVVPHAAGVSDQHLATLLVRAQQYGARLVLGFDPKRASPSSALAAQLADMLGDSPVAEAEDIVRDLRTGLIGRACRALHRDGRVRFGAANLAAGQKADFVVCDDAKCLAGLDQHIQTIRSGTEDTRNAFAIETGAGPLLLQLGQWIVVTADDYTTDYIRAGRFARVAGARPPHGLDVVHHNGVAATLDLKAFPHVRSAHVISVREARQAPKAASMLIAATTRQHAWSTALLAASRAEQVIVHVDPAVARNLTEWTAAVALSKPAPLVTDFTARDDPLAEVHLLMRRIYLGSSESGPKIEMRPSKEPWFDNWVQPMPETAKGASEEARHPMAAPNPSVLGSKPTTASGEPAPRLPDPLTEEQRRRLHEDLRASMYRDSGTRLALRRLQSALASDNDQSDINAKNLLQACRADGPMATLIQTLLGRKEHTVSDEPDDLDLPAEMTAKLPHLWSVWEIWQFKLELRTMACASSNWPLPHDHGLASRIDAIGTHLASSPPA